jgi:hemolysin activation/secretion protein
MPHDAGRENRHWEIVNTIWRFALSAFLAASCHCLPAIADIVGRDRPIPTFAELEAAGAVIGEVRLDTEDIFDEDDPRENYGLYRLLNKLHIKTRPSVIQRQLLFRSGERVSVRVIEESERLLRANDYLYDVSIRPVAYRDGVVDVEVRTRDTWSLQPGGSFSRSGGSNTTGLSLTEKNLLGTGVTVGVARGSSVDRTGQEFEISHKQVFGGWTAFSYRTATFSDGSTDAISLVRPFYSLDTRWALGGSAARFDRVDSVYTNSAIVGQYRHQGSTGEVFGGLSKGLVNGWVQRYSVGVGYQDDIYSVDPARTPPPEVPTDQTLVYPFVRYEVIEDDYVKVVNRDKIGRAEYFVRGFNGSMQLGYSSTGLGATRDLWLYSAALSKGFRTRGGDLQTSLSLSGQYFDGHSDRQFFGANARYFLPLGPRTLFYASAEASTVNSSFPTDQLLLGGDNGLRGYPLRYQSGDRRALFTVEERVYTDWYPFRLVRVGGAVFYDIGRAWGGEFENQANPGWLRDIGFGLRLTSDRSSIGNVLHLDVAFPIDAPDDIKKVQVLVKTYANF